MKKLLTLLGISVMMTGGSINMISCHKQKNDGLDTNSSLQNDMLTFTKIASKVSSIITVYDNNGNLKDSETSSELTAFYDLVNADQKQVEINSSDPNLSLGLENIKNGFRSIFDNLNFQITQEYSNYYLDTVPLTFLHKQSKFILNYIDLEKIGKLTGTSVEGVKAVQLQYNFMLNLRFKNLNQEMPVTMTYIITNKTDIIKKLLQNSIQEITKILINFFTNYQEVIIDTNDNFASIYNNFQINYSSDVRPLDNIFFSHLKTMIKTSSSIDPAVRDAIAYDDSGNKRLMRLVSGTITAENSGQIPETLDIGNYQPALWAGEGINPPGLTAENFVKAYKKSLPIFNVGQGKMMLAKLNVNLNYISLYGLPLSGTLKINNQIFESNILISQQGLENKLINFGKIIVAFHKYYRIDLKKRLDNTRSDENNFKNTSVFHVGQKLFAEFKNDISSANAIFKRLLTNFKQSSIAENLNDIELFNMHNLAKDKALWIGGANDYNVIQNKIVFNYRNGSFCLAFTFGQNRMDSIYYTAYGSNGGGIKAKYCWWAWILIDE
ncbi:hypothetical protein [Spiroplasma endosymbiont of Stenodema calcarata]|uniref:hypothetical protein n=1 Tax=Spiroplasma endosymbiont of Stenodema calcarata TaxID=3139328 RepID=UPI003CCABE3C